MAVSSSLRSRRRPFLLWWVVACLVAILLVLPARAFHLRPPRTATQLTASHLSSAAATDASVTSDTTAANDDSTTVMMPTSPIEGLSQLKLYPIYLYPTCIHRFKTPPANCGRGTTMGPSDGYSFFSAALLLCIGRLLHQSVTSARIRSPFKAPISRPGSRSRVEGPMALFGA